VPDTDNITSEGGCQDEGKQSAFSGQPSVLNQGKNKFIVVINIPGDCRVILLLKDSSQW
jgi:hypothetical protein